MSDWGLIGTVMGIWLAAVTLSCFVAWKILDKFPK
jgi:hypothetical protein